MVLCPGAPVGSTGSGFNFKASQKMGNSLRSHSTNWEKPVIQPSNPGLQDIGLSPTPRRRRTLHFETDQVKISHEIQFINIITNIKILEDRKITNIFQF